MDSEDFWKRFEKEQDYFRQLRSQKSTFEFGTYMALITAMFLMHSIHPLAGVIKWVFLGSMGVLLALHLVHTNVERRAMIKQFDKLDRLAKNEKVDVESEPYEIPRLILNNLRGILLISTALLYLAAR